MSTQKPVTNREDEMREKRGQGLAARDAVQRDGDGFLVSNLSLRRGSATTYRVSRDTSGRVSCTCAEFELEARANSTFRCEHIHAVKHWQNKQLERQAAPQPSERVANQPDVEAARDFESASPSNDDKLARFDKGKRKMRASEIEARLNNHAEAQTGEASPASERGLVQVATGEAQLMPDELEPSASEKSLDAAPGEFVKVLRQLRQPVDAKLIRAREGWTDRLGRKHMVEYIEWHTVADILDRTFPSWSHRVQSITQIGGTVAVVASITIGDVTREGVGTGAGDTETGIKKAEHDALKRAAVKFGIARELYQRETEVIETEGGGVVTGRISNSFSGDARNNRGKEQEGFKGFPPDPRAKGMNDPITPKQLGMINRIAREAGVNAEKECSQLMGCKLEDLSKRAASSLIDYLKEYPDSANKMQRRAS
ncbi:MAG: Rad52/Rad22 family DNA repair protein [Pyrinomonadaceae bacterium]